MRFLHCPLELPYAEMLALTGKAVEGDILTAVEVIPNSEMQKHVWSKYKKDVRYQWYGLILYIDATLILLN